MTRPRQHLATGLVSLGLFALPAHALAGPDEGGGNFGLGAQVGNPTALTGKWFVAGSAHALQFGVGWAWLGPTGLGHNGRAHLDWTWHPGTLASNETFDLVPYVGLGIGSGLYGHRGHGNGRHPHAYLFGRAGVLGLAFHWQRVSMDTFLEGCWTPGVGFDHDDVNPLLLMGDFAVGARWYF